ncbi:MAG TPA: LysR family transcriptional regulator [Burkholderiales bacterium]|nr:LysR family transcriptional regulator [Burkholderiales bacterium]
MDFAALQVFKAVVEEGGISPAARKLHRVQSNVTTRIQQLEASLGTKLFVREKRRLFLSPAGELFLGYVEQLLRISAQARSAVSGDAPRGVLRIGTLESSAASRLPPFLSRYHEKYPAVRVELTTGTTDSLVDAVLGRRLEAAFVAECAAAPLEVMPVFSEELVVVAPRSHAKIRRARDVQTDTVIAFPSGCAYRRRLHSWLAADGVVAEKILELSSYHAIVACVASGTGIALVPRSVLDTIRARKGVSFYPLAANKGRVTTSFVWRKGEASLALRAFRAELADFRKTGKPARIPSVLSA